MEKSLAIVQDLEGGSGLIHHRLHFGFRGLGNALQAMREKRACGKCAVFISIPTGLVMNCDGFVFCNKATFMLILN